MTERAHSDQTVQFPHAENGRPSATRYTHALLHSVVREFPDVFGGLDLPDRPARLAPKSQVAEWLLRFEILRAQSVRRSEIAQFVTTSVQQSFTLGSMAHRTTPLSDAVAHSAPALPIREIALTGINALAAGRNESALGDDMAQDTVAVLGALEASEQISEEAARALRWVLDHDGPLGHGSMDLTGHRFLLLGGTAEMAPLSLLLGCGADVLTTNTSTASLERSLAADPPLTRQVLGRLFAVRNGVDLLATPAEFAASALSFADGQRLHVGAFAYRGGEGREWRLTAAMDGIVRKLQSVGALGSITYYLSPSIVTEVSASTSSASVRRVAEQETVWIGAARALTCDRLYRPNLVGSNSRHWIRSFIPRQGVSYMAGNLFGKNYAAEVYAAGIPANSQEALRVSANVAPITRTQSTDLSQTRAAFSELQKLGITVFEPPIARRLMFLLMLRDLFGPAPSSPAALFAQQVHGGVFTNAWSLDSVLRLAYLRAIARGGA